MTISYHWLCQYLPAAVFAPTPLVDPDKLGKILTSIGLEVESMETWSRIPGGLQDLVIGEVLTCSKHPDADRLSLTTVNIGQEKPLHIVCGAPNVAKGQKVIVAPVGATIYPANGEPLTMKKAKIRGAESEGMICAEDEIGLGNSHDGILVLPADAQVGMPAATYFKVETDYIYEIGLTPNRMDAMSHLGVARDVCAWLSHHHLKQLQAVTPFKPQALKPDDGTHNAISVQIENTQACRRYSGISISGITVKESPDWLKSRLLSIGLRPINNVVDITNFILHETGQPLHAFDADKIEGRKVIVQNLPAGTPFTTLDEKERKLLDTDLMICDGQGKPMCIGGVFGGLESGVTLSTTNIFLESAWFSPEAIRKTSFAHGLRTDAATRFEKGTDISQTVAVLKRAALLIKEICGGQIASEVIDVYPHPAEKTQVALKYHYLKKLSGKNYHPDAVRKILESLGFELIKEGMDDLRFAVPYSKPDISLPADLVEEIMRIDGYDNVEIPQAIYMAPSADTLGAEERWRDKVAEHLAGQGFSEMITNSITYSQFYSPEVLAHTVHMANNLSAELDVLRPSMLESTLQVIAWNINRKNPNLQLFELGKIYEYQAEGYAEQAQLILAVTGQQQEQSWRQPAMAANLFYLKGVIERLMQLAGFKNLKVQPCSQPYLTGLELWEGRQKIATLGEVLSTRLHQFGIKQPVFIATLQWEPFVARATAQRISFKELNRFPPVERDLSIVIDKTVNYQQVEHAILQLKLPKLSATRLFDVFESDKLGAGKKSLAIHFVFTDVEKTLTDSEIEQMMQKIQEALQKQVGAQLR